MSHLNGFRAKRPKLISSINQEEDQRIDCKGDSWCQSIKSNRICVIYDDPSQRSFHHLFAHPLLQSILFADKNFYIIDTYSLAMTYCYFLRCNLPLDQYTPINFLAALYLALDIEEDTYHGRMIILILFRRGKTRAPPALLRNFNQIKLAIWKRMQYRAIVSNKTCTQIIEMMPDHPVWRRTRENWSYPTKKQTQETKQRLEQFIRSSHSEN